MRRKSTFFITPIGEKLSRNWTRNLLVLKIVFVVLQSMGYRTTRADQRYGGDISINIFEAIHSADLIIADITGQNPNVYYELGIAHAIGKQVIFIIEGDAGRLPFHTAPYRAITFTLDGPENIVKFQKELQRTIQLFETDPKQFRSRYEVFLSTFNQDSDEEPTNDETPPDDDAETDEDDLLDQDNQSNNDEE